MMLKKGFTLIELLVVIAIIAILSSVVLASLSTARMKARDAKRIADLGQIKIALELYFDAKGYYPSTYCGWDCNGYRVSYLKIDVSAFISSWTALANDLKPYISNLPVDPINSACLPFTTTENCYSYAYGNVGRSTYKNYYDIYAMLETPDHPLSCKFQKYRWGSGIYPAGQDKGLCAESAGPYNGVYPSQMYHVSNE